MARTLWIATALLLALAGCDTSGLVDDDDGGSDDDTSGPPVLVAPVDLTGVVAAGGYQLRWLDANVEETGYRLERRAEGEGEYAVIAELPADSTDHLDPDFDPATGPWYRLRAVADGAEGEPAEVDSAIPRWSYMRLIGYDSYWGESGPTMEELIAGHITYEMEWIGGSTANVALTLLGDSLGDEGSLWAYIGADGTELLDRPEVNMGHVQTYYDFFDWVVEHHPGQRYIVSYWSHGSGSAFKSADAPLHPSIGYDDHDGDALDPTEMGEVLRYLAQISGADVEVFSVCACLTQMVENAYAIADSTRYFVAGETVVGCGGDVLGVFYENPDQDGAAIAAATVDAHHTEWINDIVFSSLDLSRMPAMAGRMDQLALDLAAYVEADPAHAKAALVVAAEAQSMDFLQEYSNYTQSYLDIVDWCQRLSTLGDDAVTTSAQELAAFVEDELITNWMLQNDASGLYADAHGLSVFHPNPNYHQWDVDEYASLAWCHDTGWDEYLGLLY